MSNLTELLPAGGSGKQVDFVASGSLSNGDKVILKTDGTVEVVAESVTSVAESIPAGTEAVFNTGVVEELSVEFDPNTSGKFVVAYRDSSNSSYGTAVVGTVSGTSISFGSEYVFNSGSTSYTSLTFDPNTPGEFIVAYRDYGAPAYGKGAVSVGTISGTTLTFGTKTHFSSSPVTYVSAIADLNNANKFIISYFLAASSDDAMSVVGTVSGASISFGSTYTFKSGGAQYISTAFDPNNTNKFIVAYREHYNPEYGFVRVATVSGTSISFGTEVTVNSANTVNISAVFDSHTSGRFILTYRDGGNSYYGTAVVGTVSGTTASFGSEYVFDSSAPNFTTVAVDPNTADRIIVGSRNGIKVGTLSGTAITYGSLSVISSNESKYMVSAFDPNTSGKFVVAYRDNDNSAYGTADIGQLSTTIISTNLTSDNFLGISDAATDGDSTAILLQGGLSTNQSGLTVGSDYYVQPDGTLSTSAGTPSVKLGKALSSTTVLLSGE